MGSVLIESRLVGKLIGPRGATIQQLQTEYNVHISISKEDDADGNRTADIRGNEEDVQSAIQAIQERFCSGGGGGGGGGGYRGDRQQGGGYQGGRSYNQGGGGGYQQGGGYQRRDDRQQGGYQGGRSYNQGGDSQSGGW